MKSDSSRMHFRPVSLTTHAEACDRTRFEFGFATRPVGVLRVQNSHVPQPDSLTWSPHANACFYQSITQRII